MNLLLPFLMLLPLVARAQDPTTDQPDGSPFGYPHWASAADSADSADFSHFRQGLRWERPVSSTDTTTTQYRQVWIKDLHGGLTTISRGDGSLMPYRADQVFDWLEVIPFRMADGRRGLALAHETPCGLICSNTVYYVEDR